MFDTHVTIVGNVLTAPEWRRTSNTNSLVTNFKVASTARRLDRENGRWVDGNSLRVRVNCWRKLAEGVAASVMVGDPIVVVGRLYTRDWIDSDQNRRTLYELEAVAVGHDLARGRGRFARNRPTLATSSVEDLEADTRVQGHPTEAVPDEQAPARPGEVFDDSDLFDMPLPPEPEHDELAVLRGAGFDPAGRYAPGRPGPYGSGGPGEPDVDPQLAAPAASHVAAPADRQLAAPADRQLAAAADRRLTAPADRQPASPSPAGGQAHEPAEPDQRADDGRPIQPEDQGGLPSHDHDEAADDRPGQPADQARRPRRARVRDAASA